MENNNQYVPSFLDITKSSHRHIYNCLMNMVQCIEKARGGKILNHRVIDSMYRIIDMEFDDIIAHANSTTAVDIKLYLLDLIQIWIDKDIKRQDFESCANLVKMSNYIWGV